MKIQTIISRVENSKTRSAWSKGVKEYALELLEERQSYYDELNLENVDKILLNGASSWSEFSWGGCSFIYNEDIAERLCTPSELKRTKNGRLSPNKNESWLDTQARALYQANRLIRNAIRG